jgi:hypothetical protein
MSLYQVTVHVQRSSWNSVRLENTKRKWDNSPSRIFNAWAWLRRIRHAILEGLERAVLDGRNMGTIEVAILGEVPDEKIK